MKLGIIAGGGALPIELAAHCRDSDIDHHVFVIARQGYVDMASPCTTFRLGAVGSLVKLLRQQAITDLVFIGSVKRPSLLALRPDWFLLRQLPKLGLLRGGDDSLLRRVTNEFERQLGMKVRGIHDLMPELLAPVGVIGTIVPAAELQSAITKGIIGAQALGRADKGQAVIATAAGIIMKEDKAGTAAMLRQAAELSLKNAILVKLSKPQQDLRLDLPTIGPQTVEQAAAAGLMGIVVEAGKTLIVDQAETAAVADRLALFLLGLKI